MFTADLYTDDGPLALAMATIPATLPAGFFTGGGILDELATASALDDHPAYLDALTRARAHGATDDQISDAHHYGWTKAGHYGHGTGAPGFDWRGNPR